MFIKGQPQGGRLVQPTKGGPAAHDLKPSLYGPEDARGNLLLQGLVHCVEAFLL